VISTARVRVDDPYRSNSSRFLDIGRTLHVEPKLCRETLHQVYSRLPPTSYSRIPDNRRQANGPKEAEDPYAEGARQKTSSSSPSSARKRPWHPPTTNGRLPYMTIVVVVGGDGGYALVHR